MAAAHLSPYTGTWYPGDPGELNAILDESFEKSRARTGPHTLSGGLAFVVPHAAPIYSGAVAASVYRHAGGARRIVLLGFSHRQGHPGVAVPKVEVYATPVGEVEVDRESAQLFPRLDICDHSVDIQMPFIRRAAPGSRVLPIYIGILDDRGRKETATLLETLVEPGTVFIVSSDFTHFGSAFYYQPFSVNARTAEKLRELDLGVIAAAGSLEPRLFLDELKQTGSTVCGRAPIALLLELLGRLEGEEIFQQTLDYQTSGEITGDYSHSVSYAALGYFPASSFWLDQEEQNSLLRSARETLERWRATGDRLPVPPLVTTPLTRRAPVFVTLKDEGRLRGCVGRVVDPLPLAQAVPEMTLAAALDDSRFAPLNRREAPVDIEITLLSPMKRVRSQNQVQIPDHGVHLQAGDRAGLLLPQVARERSWSREQLLSALAVKAGVPADESGILSVFRAQTFGGT
jgi:AmmeMemoRadiSam system protein B/AmmeMemoRadiSam system protein A